MITDCEPTKASGEQGSDAVVGVKMIARDRYHQPAVDDGACPAAPADAGSGDINGGGGQPDPAKADTDENCASWVAAAVYAVVAATVAVAAVAWYTNDAVAAGHRARP